MSELSNTDLQFIVEALEAATQGLRQAAQEVNCYVEGQRHLNSELLEIAVDLGAAPAKQPALRLVEDESDAH